METLLRHTVVRICAQEDLPIENSMILHEILKKKKRHERITGPLDSWVKLLRFIGHAKSVPLCHPPMNQS